MKSRPKPAAASAKPASRPDASTRTNASGRTVILVRRGALRRFDALSEKTADLPVVVSWDRRLGDRRTAKAKTPADRRAGDRRTTPPFTWNLADFVVLPGGAVDDTLEATATPRKPSSARKTVGTKAATRPARAASRRTRSRK